jgi:hypothetical protein
VYHKCNLCNPPEGDRFLIVMHGVPFKVMHTKRHGDELVRKLSRWRDDPYREVVELIPAVSDKPESPVHSQQLSQALNQDLQKIPIPPFLGGHSKGLSK